MAALYNRYIRGSDGGYTRVAQSDPPPHSAPPPPPGPDIPPPPPPPPRDPPPPGRAPEMDLLNRLLARLHLGDLDSGDLLTLLLLFLLFRGGRAVKLPTALGLVLFVKPSENPF